MNIPKYCALCEDDLDFIHSCGTGHTPDEAFNDFIGNGLFQAQCQYWEIEPGKPVEVYIYSVIPYENSEWPQYDETQEIDWCINRKIKTIQCEAI